ncbi:hypothetical protein CC79DRAFT_1365043 [Sarocladium strictum]
MAHVHMAPAQHTFNGHYLTAPSPALPTSSPSAPSTSTSTSSSTSNTVPNQESAQRCMAMLSQELSTVADRDIPSQAEAIAAPAQGSVPYATPSQSTHVNVMVARTIRAAIAEMRANANLNNNT